MSLSRGLSRRRFGRSVLALAIALPALSACGFHMRGNTDFAFKRLYINYSDNVKPANVKFDRRDNGWTLKVNYEVRRQLVGNLDVVGKFDSSQDLTRSGAE